MIESHINSGRQDVPVEGPAHLKHGVSITDACVDWDVTVKMLDQLNDVGETTIKYYVQSFIPIFRLWVGGARQ